MSDPRPTMLRRVPAVVVLCALITLLSSQPASAAVTVSGSCAYVGTTWKLTVDQYDATHLRVSFVIKSGDPGSVWQLFGSDDGHPFATKTKTANLNGVVRVSWRPLDRGGSDAIDVSGSGNDGNICSGSVMF